MSMKATLNRFAVATILLVTGPANAETLLDPVFRYSIDGNEESVSEYIGEPQGPFSEQFNELPEADGPMTVDCANVSEIGVVINPKGVGGWIDGAKRKYHFQWSHSEVSPEPVSLMRFRRNAPGGLLRHGIKLDKWLVDGTIHLTIEVKGEAVFETDYILTNCG